MVLSTLDTEDNVEPNETRITPLSSELCIKVSNSAETGLGGLVRSGPTTLVSRNTIFFQHNDKHSKLINFCMHTMYYFSIVLYVTQPSFSATKIVMVSHQGRGWGFEDETLNLFQFCQDAHYSCYKSPVWKQKRKEKRGHENSPGGLSSILLFPSLPLPHGRHRGQVNWQILCSYYSALKVVEARKQ